MIQAIPSWDAPLQSTSQSMTVAWASIPSAPMTPESLMVVRSLQWPPTTARQSSDHCFAQYTSHLICSHGVSFLPREGSSALQLRIHR
eukprot:CAMPEP_0181440408 /NCGR_PEP_ID=MMETSP1110-20121109/22953_1 /TAXON_ID=174948 /ORGANISM="Symbiodinium sp., Strain CCMP421" /LENGTH=87 /DNA_ID=CAMNT_0023564213 /DNA_START=189 /DNA_END=452 /DNA_ORIENTATION=-